MKPGINDFDPRRFLAIIGKGRTILSVRKKQTIFAQGDTCDAVFYVQKGEVKLTVVMGRFTLPSYLRITGCVATAVMFAAAIGVLVTSG